VPDLDGNGEEDVSTLNQSTEKQFDESSQLLDVLPEHMVRYCCYYFLADPKHIMILTKPVIYVLKIQLMSSRCEKGSEVDLLSCLICLWTIMYSSLGY
jgi:hypothetical protein